MAKYTATLPGSRDELAEYIKTHAKGLGVTVSLEEEQAGEAGPVKYWVGTFERYALVGKNRSSLTVVLMEHGEGVDVVATASGGSQAVYLKVNVFSEQSFLEDFEKLMGWYLERRS